MILAFAQPTEATIDDAVDAIREDLDFLEAGSDDWYQFIIDAGRKLPSFPSEWMDTVHKVPGCLSQVWMECLVEDGRLYFAGVSDSSIVCGLVALLLRIFSGRLPVDILKTDLAFMTQLGLASALSNNRSNGLASMALAMRDAAAKSALST